MGMIYNAPRQSGKSSYVLKKAIEQWEKYQYYKKKQISCSHDAVKVCTQSPDQPLVLVPDKHTVLTLKEEYYKKYGVYPDFTICTIMELVNNKSNLSNKRYKLFIDNAEVVFNDVFKVLGLSGFDTAVMTAPTVKDFKNMD